MIITTLKDCSRYENLHPKFKMLFDYMKSTEILHLPLGRIELCGEELFINNVEPAALTKEEQPLELHESYIDVHMLFSGKESMGWLPTDKITSYSKPYEADEDCALTADTPTTYIVLKPYDMAIVYPEDAHAPLIGTGKIRKMIAKVKL
ncbi:MAG: YhcH/YjgK/YiaL family protein [Phocaeicola sp.]